jgi:hypothetical protein
MLDNTATPYYYEQFRHKVLAGEIVVNKEISLEMNRIDDLIANPNIYYDAGPVEGFIKYCEMELTLTDGSDLHLLDTFKLWAEQIFGWYYYVERSIFDPTLGEFIKKTVKKRLTTKQYLIVARGAAKSLFASILLECRYRDHSSDHDSSDDEASRRGHVANSYGYYSISWAFVQVPYRRFCSEHFWISCSETEACCH